LGQSLLGHFIVSLFTESVILTLSRKAETSAQKKEFFLLSGREIFALVGY